DFLCLNQSHLNDLKKENFSLKLRIYFLEEKIQQKFEASSDDVHRRVSDDKPQPTLVCLKSEHTTLQISKCS
uniref:Centrosomin N-terminal motif 1 domain-containing protein n=1 Tax=Oryzias melastigma TaxID=30732 RepID=A0A3B3DMU1_ORYME